MKSDLRAEIQDLPTEVRSDMQSLRVEVRGGLQELGQRIDGISGEIVQFHERLTRLGERTYSRSIAS